jgi:hypothetical protein
MALMNQRAMSREGSLLGRVTLLVAVVFAGYLIYTQLGPGANVYVISEGTVSKVHHFNRARRSCSACQSRPKRSLIDNIRFCVIRALLASVLGPHLTLPSIPIHGVHVGRLWSYWVYVYLSVCLTALGRCPAGPAQRGGRL